MQIRLAKEKNEWTILYIYYLKYHRYIWLGSKKGRKNHIGHYFEENISKHRQYKNNNKTEHVGKFIKIKERKQGLGVFYNFCAT